MRTPLKAAAEGDVAGLERVLAADVVLRSDGGGEVSAARRPVVGADRVVRFLAGLAPRRRRAGIRVEPALVDGAAGVVLRGPDGKVGQVWAVEVRDARVVGVAVVMAPSKLRHLTGAAGGAAAPGD